MNCQISLFAGFSELNYASEQRIPNPPQSKENVPIKVTLCHCFKL